MSLRELQNISKPIGKGFGLRWRRRLRRVASATGGVLAVGITVAACGDSPSTLGVANVSSSSTTTTTASSSAGSSTHATGQLAYVSCMHSHGVPNFPDPNSSGAFPELKSRTALQDIGVSTSQLSAASHDCVHLLPAGNSQTVTLQQQPDYLRAAACMRSHGITNFPDPVFSGGTATFPIPSSIDTHSTQFTQAQQTCEKLIPAGLPYSGTSG